MSFQDAMNAMLPPICVDGKTIEPHKTSGYGGWRAKTGTYHYAIDFNYVGGQSAAANKNHPCVYSPVSGTVVPVPGRDHYGAVHIKDKDGNIHKILHLDSESVKPGDAIKAGEAIGTMGNTAPKGKSLDQHVHYAIEDKNGKAVNPEIFWKDRKIEKAADKKVELDGAVPTLLSTREQIVTAFGEFFNGIKTKPFENVLTRERWTALGIAIPESAKGASVVVNVADGRHLYPMYHLAEFGLNGKELAAAKQLTEKSYQASVNAEAIAQGKPAPFNEPRKGPERDV